MLFSVIVPIYNVQPYLRECIDSVLNQSYPDFELILVDDGSPDQCPMICDEYAVRDSRIHVVHKKNGGLVSARQAGLKIAQGDYIINLDSDDWVDLNYLQKAADIISAHDPDIISFSVQYVYPQKTVSDPEVIAEGFYDKSAMQKSVYPEMLCSRSMTHLHYYLCSKVFRKSKLYDSEMNVDTSISQGEDVACLIPACLASDSIYFSKDIVYNIRCHGDSMSRSHKNRYFDNIINVTAHLKKVTASYPTEYQRSVDRYCSFMIFVQLVIAAEHNQKDAIDYLKSVWNNSLTESFANSDFQSITLKSTIAVFLLSRKQIGAAYHFLHFCNRMKKLLKK